jgi:alpha-1,6-mannosyltransferase
LPVLPHGAWASAWVAAVVAALVLYGVGAAAARRAGLVAVVVVAVVVQVLPLASPLLLSKDAYLYWSQARVLIVHGGNPYSDSPARFPADPSYAYTSESWRGHTTDYAPLWELVGTAPAAVGGTSAHRSELAYRVLAVLGVLAAVVLVARRTRSAAATAFVGWNPLLALHFAGGGHNDAVLAVLLALGAVYAGRAPGGAAWAGATFFKGFPGLFVPLELARVRLRARQSFWLGLAAATAVLVVASFAVFGTAWVTTAFTGANTPSGLGGVHWLEQAGLRYRYAVAVGGLVFVCVYAALLRHAWRHGRARFSLAASALCICAAQLRPWYAIWPVVLAGAEDDALAAVAAFALTAYLLLADAVRL